MLKTLTLVVPLVAAACTGFGIKADAGYGQLGLSGDLALEPSAGGVSLGTIRTDVESDLGLDEAMATPYGRIEAALGIGALTLSGFDIDQRGSGTLRFRFGDIPASTQVNTDLSIRNLKGAFHFDLLNLGVFRLSPGVGVDLFDLELRATAPALPGATETVDVLAPVPMLFVQAETDLSFAELVVDVGAMDVDARDAKGTFVDGEAIARFRPSDHVELFAGYKLVLLDADGTTNGQSFLADLELSGWFVGGGIYF